MRKKGFTLIELLVVISIIAMLLAILMPALGKVKKIAMRVVCATNLKGLGTAQMVYANDYEDDYVLQGQRGSHTWTDSTSEWQVENKNWNTSGGTITVGASLYLLVREADVSPKSFVCPSSDQKVFTGINTNNLELIELWDFGNINWADHPEGPTTCVSYAYQMPYGGTGAASTGASGLYAASGAQSAAFAMMADKNPYFEPKLSNGGANVDNWTGKVKLQADDWTDTTVSLEKWETQVPNALSHDREGQNVLYGDGHASYEKRADVGVQNDGIYVAWADDDPVTETTRRRGLWPTTRDTSFLPKNANDSVLVNDDMDIE